MRGGADAMKLLLLIAGLVLGGIVFLLRLRPPKPDSADHGLVCGACGYSVIGLERMICPECGCDLREVGIIPPGRRPAEPVAAAIALLILTFCVAGGLIAVALDDVLPVQRVYASQVVFKYFNPASSVTVGAAGSNWSAQRLILPVKVDLAQAPRAPAPLNSKTLMADVATRTLRWTDSNGRAVQVQGRISASEIRRWLKDCGVDESTSPIPAQADQIVAAINTVARQGPLLDRVQSYSGPFNPSFNAKLTSSARAEVPRILLNLLWAAYVGLFVLALSYVWMSRRPRMRESPHGGAQATSREGSMR
jgi:hypothetical protein